MNIPEIPHHAISRAANGELSAMEDLLRSIEPGVYNLAIRMLGNREDARDASQEILLKVITHLGGFRQESAFSTWVYRIARNHLLTAAIRMRESPEVSFEQITDKLQQGLDYGRRQIVIELDSGAMSPEDKVAATSVAIGCTQGMLMALDRDQRLTYLLDVVFGLSSAQAAEVIGVTAATYRKRLSRVRERLQSFMHGTCGLVNPAAACRCEGQVTAVRALAASGHQAPGIQPAPAEMAQLQFAQWRQFGDAAAVFRGHPDYRAPGEMLGAIRRLLMQQGYLSEPSRA